jgi:hypothetical protein
MPEAKKAVVDLSGGVVVLDTNILQQTGLLRDPLSISLLFYLVQVGASFGLPEVLRREWREHWIDHCVKRSSALNKEIRWLHTHFGNAPRPVTDMAEQAGRVFDERLAELGDLLIEFEIADSDWVEAGQMVMEKRAPTKEGSQQFKDSLLWRALLRIGQSHHVVFVTADKGFLDAEGSDLHATLRAEAEDLDVDIMVLTSMPPLLEALRFETQAYAEFLGDLEDAYSDPVIDAINEVLEPHGQFIEGLDRWSSEAFATGNPQTFVLAIDVEAQVMEDDDPVADMPFFVEVAGSVLIDDELGEVVVDLDTVRFVASTPHGDHSRMLLERPPRPPEPIRVRLP